MQTEASLQLSRSAWVPYFVRKLIPEFLDHIVALVEANKPFVPLVQVKHDRKTEFYLHAPEAGGSSVLLAKYLKADFPESEICVLTDQLDDSRAAHFREVLPELRASTVERRMSALSSATNSCERIVFSINQAHLLSDEELLEQLRDMATKFDQILIGEGNNKSVRQVIGMLLLSPLVAIFTGPMVKPFRLSRMILTYLIPVLPFIIAWDGIVALFRIRSPEKIKALVESSDLGKKWKWTSGKSPNNRGGFVIYLHGTKLM